MQQEKKYPMLPTNDAVQNWFEDNIGKECSASSAIYKFRLWLESMQVEHPAGSNVWVKADERVPLNDNLYHLNYGTGKTDMKTTGFYDGEKWHRQDGAVLDWHPNLEWLDEQPIEQKEWDSKRMIGRVKDRFKELEEKQHDWRSFYNGWLEGRADMLSKKNGWGMYKNEQKENEAVGKFLEWLYENDITRHSNGHWYKWDKGQAKEAYYANDLQHIAQLYNEYQKEKGC